jgi:hypothetical protein
MEMERRLPRYLSDDEVYMSIIASVELLPRSRQLSRSPDRTQSCRNVLVGLADARLNSFAIGVDKDLRETDDHAELLFKIRRFFNPTAGHREHFGSRPQNIEMETNLARAQTWEDISLMGRCAEYGKKPPKKRKEKRKALALFFKYSLSICVAKLGA